MGKFHPVFGPAKARHTFEFERAGGLLDVFKDAFEPTTFMLIGAGIQCLALSVLPFRVAIVPTVLLLAVTLLDTILQTLQITPRRAMKGMLPGRTVGLVPSKDGTISDKPSAEPIVVFLLGARCNHPLGPFAPNMKELGEYFGEMQKYALANTTKYGLLGATNWNRSEHHIYQNMTVFYFRTVEGLHEFAKSQVHVDGVKWWSQITKAKSNAHVGIMHETYSVPAGNWESIYENFQPTGLGALSIGAKDESTGEYKWVRSITAVGRKSQLRTMYGRMGKTDGADNEKWADEGFM